MSKTIFISSQKQFDTILSSTRIVIADFYADHDSSSQAIAPLFERLSSQLSRPQVVAFAKVNTASQAEIAKKYGVTTLPTFIVFKNGTVAQTVKGADPSQLGPVVQKIVEEIETSSYTGSSGGSGSNTGTGGGFGDADALGGPWLGASLPRGYKDVTEEVDLRGLELLNADAEFGGARELFEARRPSALDSKGKGKEEKEGEDKGKRRDWVESDTDAQLMLFVPFQSTLKVHSLHVTSLSPSKGEEEVVRPRTIELYTNRAHTLGFDEAESVPETQRIELKPGDWDKETGTARVELRFVKFQNVTSLVIFVVDGEGDGERTRIDRIRLIGESGEKREMGKLEKIGEGSE